MTTPDTKYPWWDSRQDNTFFPTVYYEGDHSIEGHLCHLSLNLMKRTNRECDFIEEILSPDQGNRILDCPCGYGRHSLELGRRGYQLTGVDLCFDFLQKAQTQCEIDQLQKNVTFLQGDMRSLPASLNGFDFCINMFFSFGFFNEKGNNETLKQFSRVLKPGGKLLIHTDVNPSMIQQGSYGDRKIRSLTTGATLILKENYNTNNKRLEGSWTIIRQDGVTISAHYSVRIYSNFEIEKLLMKNGFHKFEIIPLDKKNIYNSQDIIYTAEKNR